MIHITLSNSQPVELADDALGRSRYGFDEDMTPEDLYEANHGCWVLGARAERERFVLFTYDNVVRLAVAIREIVPAPGRPDRRVVNGDILQQGHPVYDDYVGAPSPAPPARNPVTYVESQHDLQPCKCGCGELIRLGDFVPGHEHKALHAALRRSGL